MHKLQTDFQIRVACREIWNKSLLALTLEVFETIFYSAHVIGKP
jgi:hypothetical protein